MPQFYITTPIYYVNDKPHLGHAYATIFADVIHRSYELLGWETFFLTGTDEHGQKVYQAAKKMGKTPKEHVEQTHGRFKEMWQKLNIEYDFFIRTTDPVHIQYVQRALQKLFDQGDIYQKEYSGWYSVGEERFFAEDELIDGCDPISGRPVEWEKEKNYFFCMSKYQNRLIKHLDEFPDFIFPLSRMNEVRGFLKKPLEDLCISRPKRRLPWGIALPFDPEFVTYVWFDALLNYLSAVEKRSWPGSPTSSPTGSQTGSQTSSQTAAPPRRDLGLWPASAHIIGKDIVITHGVYFPTMLFALDLPLPQHLVAHGWWLQKGKKMSKTAGNVVDPVDMLGKNMDVDYCRYFLCKEMRLGNDVSYDQNFLARCINGDLANGLGNTLNRLHKLILTINPDGKWKLTPCQQDVFAAKDIDWRQHRQILQNPDTVASPAADADPYDKIDKIIELIFAKQRQHRLELLGLDLDRPNPINPTKPISPIDPIDPKANQRERMHGLGIHQELATSQEQEQRTALLRQLQGIIVYTQEHLIWRSLPKHLLQFDLSWLLQDIQEVIAQISIILESHTPWRLNPKNDKTLLTTLLFPCWEALRICFVLLLPVMPQKCTAALEIFGYSREMLVVSKQKLGKANHQKLGKAGNSNAPSPSPLYAWGNAPKTISTQTAPNIFPRWKPES